MAELKQDNEVVLIGLVCPQCGKDEMHELKPIIETEWTGCGYCSTAWKVVVKVPL